MSRERDTAPLETSDILTSDDPAESCSKRANFARLDVIA